MWRIDHGDHDDDDLFITSIGRAVDVLEAYPFASPIANNPSLHRDSYRFFFIKNVIGRAQAKVFATCISDKTEGSGGHAHQIVTTIQPDILAQPTGPTTTADCPKNYFVAQSGFKINQTDPNEPEPYLGHLSESWMANNMRSWTWDIDLTQDAGATVDYFWSCVKRRVQNAGGEKHKLIYRRQGPETSSISKNRVRTRRIVCGAHYKAIVAGFSFTPLTSVTNTMAEPNAAEFPGLQVPIMWFLGMDPQPKNRDFKVLNADPNLPHDVTLKAICLNYRTT